MQKLLHLLDLSFSNCIEHFIDRVHAASCRERSNRLPRGWSNALPLSYIVSPRRIVFSTMPLSVLPSYGVSLCLCRIIEDSTVKDPSGFQTTRSASNPGAIFPFCLRPASRAGASDIQ